MIGFFSWIIWRILAVGSGASLSLMAFMAWLKLRGDEKSGNGNMIITVMMIIATVTLLIALIKALPWCFSKKASPFSKETS